RSLLARVVVDEILDQAPVVIYLRSFGAGSDVPDAPEVAPGVFVVDGPPTGPVAPNDVAHGDVIGHAVGFGAVLMLIGMGWSTALTSGSILVRLGLSMPFALASLAIVGTVMSRVAVPLDGGPAIAIVAATGGIGWLAALARGAEIRKRSSRSDPALKPDAAGDRSSVAAVSTSEEGRSSDDPES
ncbi:MAG: hypothetical protein ACRELC_00695, partial [Gemmatimonadota bacterium]